VVYSTLDELWSTPIIFVTDVLFRVVNVGYSDVILSVIGICGLSCFSKVTKKEALG